MSFGLTKADMNNYFRSKIIILCLFYSFLPCPIFAEQGIIFSRLLNSQSDLYFVDLHGKNIVLIAADPAVNELFFAYFKKERRVFFTKSSYNNTDRARNNDLYSIKIGDKKPIPLAVSEADENFVYIMTDGRVIFQRTTKDDDNLYIVNADGTNVRAMTTGPNHKIFRAVTKDDKRVIYLQTVKGGYSEKLYSVDIDGKDDRLISHTPVILGGKKGSDSFELLTHDNRIIFYSYEGGNKKGHLYIVNPDGTNQMPIANSPMEESVVKLLDDNRLIFREDSADSTNFYIADLNEKEIKPIPITRDSGKKGFQGITTDGKVIFSKAKEEEENDLYIINSDGTDKISLTKGPGFKKLETLTEDGQMVYTNIVKGKNDIYITTLDATRTIPLANSDDNEVFKVITKDKRVVFERLVKGKQWDIYTVNLDGTNLTPIGKTVEHEVFINLTSDDRIIFRRIPTPESRNAALYIADQKGKIIPVAASEADEVFVALTSDDRVIFMIIAEVPEEEKKKKPEHPVQKQGDIYIVNKDGREIIPLASSSDPEQFIYLIE